MRTNPHADLASVLGDLASVLNEMRAPVFLVATDSRGSHLTLHVHSGCDVSALRAQADRAMTRSGESVRVSVRAHNLRQLAFPHSLEHWLKRLDVGNVIYDPTMIVTRARSLLQAAMSLRAALGNTIRGSFFDSDHRTLFIMTRSISDVARAAAVRLKIATLINEAFRWGAREASPDAARPLPINVQVVSVLPRRNLVPVDAKSTSLARRIGHTIGRWLALGTVAVAMTAASLPAGASYGPARSGSEAFGTQASGPKAPITGDFGVLSGLSVFTDGRRPSEPATSASTGLRLYFGEGNHVGGGLLQLAKKAKKQRCFDRANPSVKWDCPTPGASPAS